MFIHSTTRNKLIFAKKLDKIDALFSINEIEQSNEDDCTKTILSGSSCNKYIMSGCITFKGFSQPFPKPKPK